MDKVYVLTSNHGYGYDDLQSIHKTYEGAQEEKHRLIVNYHYDPETLWIDSREVKE